MIGDQKEKATHEKKNWYIKRLTQQRTYA